MEPRVRKMSKKGVERDFTNEVIDFQICLEHPLQSRWVVEESQILLYVCLLSRSCTQEPEKMISEPELSK